MNHPDCTICAGVFRVHSEERIVTDISACVSSWPVLLASITIYAHANEGTGPMLRVSVLVDPESARNTSEWCLVERIICYSMLGDEAGASEDLRVKMVLGSAADCVDAFPVELNHRITVGRYLVLGNEHGAWCKTIRIPIAHIVINAPLFGQLRAAIRG